jgi:hypothetical protein
MAIQLPSPRTSCGELASFVVFRTADKTIDRYLSFSLSATDRYRPLTPVNVCISKLAFDANERDDFETNSPSGEDKHDRIRQICASMRDRAYRYSRDNQNIARNRSQGEDTRMLDVGGKDS